MDMMTKYVGWVLVGFVSEGNEWDNCYGLRLKEPRTAQNMTEPDTREVILWVQQDTEGNGPGWLAPDEETKVPAPTPAVNPKWAKAAEKTKASGDAERYTKELVEAILKVRGWNGKEDFNADVANDIHKMLASEEGTRLFVAYWKNDVPVDKAATAIQNYFWDLNIAEY